MRLALRIVDPTNKACQSQFNFRSGDVRPLAFQIYDQDTMAPAVIASGITLMTLTLPAVPTDVTKTNTEITQSTISSIFSCDITAANSALMQTGGLTFKWQEGTSPTEKIYTAVGELLIKKQV